MTTPLVHAPNGGLSGSPLCESKQGDTTDYEGGVDCGQCLDAIEDADPATLLRMKAHGFHFRMPSP